MPQRSSFVKVVLALAVGAIVVFAPLLAADPAGEGNSIKAVRSPAELDAVIAATPDGELKNALQVHRTAILAALARRGHVDAVVGAVKRSPGKFDPVNDTPESLRKALGGDLPAFDSLIAVDLAMPNVGPHAHREVDPYDAAFFEHLGQIDTLESLNIIATKLNDDWIVPLNRLHKLKTLKFTNNGKLTDAGLEKLSGLTQLESFSFVGTKMQGHAFAKFEGWTKLTRSSFRGSSLDDAGLQFLCERFPNYESLSLAHAHFTDAGAVHLAKLTKLKGLELGSREATPNCLQAITTLSLEYLQLGDGLDAPTGIALIKDMPTLRRLTLTDASALTDDNLKLVSEMKQLEQLELGRPAMPAERLELMKDFGFLKSLRLTPGREPLAPETQERLHAALPKTELKFQ